MKNYEYFLSELNSGTQLNRYSSFNRTRLFSGLKTHTAKELGLFNLRMTRTASVICIKSELGFRICTVNYSLCSTLKSVSDMLTRNNAIIGCSLVSRDIEEIIKPSIDIVSIEPERKTHNSQKVYLPEHLALTFYNSDNSLEYINKFARCISYSARYGESFICRFNSILDSSGCLNSLSSVSIISINKTAYMSVNGQYTNLDTGSSASMQEIELIKAKESILEYRRNLQ